MHPLRALIRLILPGVLGGLAAAYAAAPDPALTKARQTMAALPLRFEANAGQWDPQVRFAARTGSHSLALAGREAVVSLGGRRVAISLLGANCNSRMEGLDPLPAAGNYFLGNRREAWRAGVPQYGRVRYQEVYSGIDLVYYGNAGQLEYDFVLAPGADPSRIRLRFRGADRLSLTPEGDLALEAGSERLVQKRPLVYQADVAGTRRAIDARYRLLGPSTAAVEVGAYDASRPLTIDPVLQYATLLGGGAGDAVTCVKIDPQGFIWAAGYITDGSIPAAGESYNGSFTGSTDIFVAKIDPHYSGAASLVYFTYIGGSGPDSPTDMTLDAAGNVYLTGTTTSSNFPLAGWAAQSFIGASDSSDAFVLKLRPTVAGTDGLAFSTYLGGKLADEARGIALDGSGNIFVTGLTKSENFPVTGTAYQSTLWGPLDAFIAKLNPNSTDSAATLMYSTYLGGEGYDEGRSVVVARDGTAWVAGVTTSTQFPWSGNPYSPNPVGGVDLFLARVDATRAGSDSIPYATYFGGTGQDDVRKIVLDANGKLLITGFTLSTDFPVTDGAFQSTASGGGGDAFVTRLDPTARREEVVEYSTYLGGTAGDVGRDLAVDPAGNIWVTGYTLSPDFPVTGDALAGAWPGGLDVFLTRLDPTRAGGDALLYSTYLGKINLHNSYAVATGPNGVVAVGGSTGQPNIQATANGLQQGYAGGVSDGFLVVLAP